MGDWITGDGVDKQISPCQTCVPQPPPALSAPWGRNFRPVIELCPLLRYPIGGAVNRRAPRGHFPVKGGHFGIAKVRKGIARN